MKVISEKSSYNRFLSSFKGLPQNKMAQKCEYFFLKFNSCSACFNLVLINFLNLFWLPRDRHDINCLYKSVRRRLNVIFYVYYVWVFAFLVFSAVLNFPSIFFSYLSVQMLKKTNEILVKRASWIPGKPPSTSILGWFSTYSTVYDWSCKK
jgi:hypothetical protein